MFSPTLPSHRPKDKPDNKDTGIQGNDDNIQHTYNIHDHNTTTGDPREANSRGKFDCREGPQVFGTATYTAAAAEKEGPKHGR